MDRFALTQWDYGSFQDRIIINNLLSSLAVAEVRLLRDEAPEIVSAFKKVSKKRDLWQRQATELLQLDAQFDHFPFFNCWFLSLPQLLLVLRYSNGNEDFEKVVSSTRHVTMGTNNFYFEFYHSYILGHQSNLST